MTKKLSILVIVLALTIGSFAYAQSRPLQTNDPQRTELEALWQTQEKVGYRPCCQTRMGSRHGHMMRGWRW